jgi:YbbR domain-containing protein
VQVVVDLGDSHSGTNIIPLRTDEVVSPLGVEVLQIDPGTVTVTLERSGVLDVLVQPKVEGQPAPGFQVSGVQVVPQVVTVAGPESRLKSPFSVITERIVLDGRKSGFVQDVGVGVADSQLRIVRPHAVRVTVGIVPVPAAGASGTPDGAPSPPSSSTPPR